MSTPTPFRDRLATASGALTSSQVSAAVSPLLSPRTVEDWRTGRREPADWAQAWILASVARAEKKRLPKKRAA